MRTLTLLLALWLPLFGAAALGHSHGPLTCHADAPALAAASQAPCGPGAGLGSLSHTHCALCTASANLQAASAISDAGLGLEAPSGPLAPAPTLDPRPVALFSPTGRAPPA